MPGIAPRFMAWKRRMGGTPGPLGGSGEAGNGNPVQVELQIAGTWTDITAYVMVRDNGGNIAITRGRREEGSQTEQSTCRLTLNNRDGRFSPRNPVGPYYGLIGRNQPIRISVPDGLGGKNYRFWGEVSAWPQMWDPTGTDVWVDLEASGVMRRLSQSPAPAHSLLYNAVIDQITAPNLLAYWPCEDATDATSIASALTNGSAMILDGTPTFASFSDFGSSDPVPDFTNAGATGGVTRYSTTNMAGYQLRYLLNVPTAGFNDVDTITRLKLPDSASTVYLDVHYNSTLGSFGNPGTLSVTRKDGDQAYLGGSGSENLTLDTRGRQLLVSVEVSSSGSTLSATLRVLDLLTSVEDSTTLSWTESLTMVENVGVAPETLYSTAGVPSAAIGHVILQPIVTPMSELGRAVNPVGETAGRRIQRVCDTEALAFDGIGDLDDTVTMGAQTKINPLDVMRECELADAGMLTENLGALGLGYRTRNSLTNQDAQLTLNYEAFHLAEVPTPIEDDRYIQNRVVVTIGDVSATYSLDEGTLSTLPPPTGVGIYGEDVTLNLENSSFAEDQAAWRVHIGTVDEARFPQIAVNLAHSSFTSDPLLKLAALGLRQGDRVVIQNPPSWLPPDDIDQIILGFDETITHFEHRITFTCSPASPYRVGITNQDIARVDTDGSALVSDVTSSATSLVVAPTDSDFPLWTTSDAEFPFDVRMGGEIISVTDITGYVEDAFGRTSSNGWGSADTGQAWTVTGGDAADYAVGSGIGTVTQPATNTAHLTLTSSPSADVDVYVDVAASALASGASLVTGPLIRAADASNWYVARVEFTTAAAIQISIRKRVAGSETTLSSVVTTALTHVADTYYTVRFKASGASLMAKIWLSTDLQPATWDVTATDASLQSADNVGTRSFAATGSLLVNPVLKFDNFQLANPQTFTVTRSVNGVQKSHSAEADIRLAYPTTVSL